MPPTAPEHELQPLALDRVAKVLDSHGDVYQVDDDGALLGAWDEHLFRFGTLTESGLTLQVRGQWATRLPAAELGQLLAATNTWAQQMIWPKVYVQLQDDEVTVVTEHSVDYSHGVTDAQLELHVRTALGSSLGFFRALDQRYPPHPQ